MLLAGCLLATACSADRHGRRDAPPLDESHEGIPLLQDLPILGFFFGRRTVVR